MIQPRAAREGQAAVTHVGDDDDLPRIEPGCREVDMPERTVTRLYGPRGEVLRTFSDRPPVGFHQGERSLTGR